MVSLACCHPIFTVTVDGRDLRVQPFFGGNGCVMTLPAGYTGSENALAGSSETDRRASRRTKAAGTNSKFYRNSSRLPSFCSGAIFPSAPDSGQLPRRKTFLSTDWQQSRASCICFGHACRVARRVFLQRSRTMGLFERLSDYERPAAEFQDA